MITFKGRGSGSLENVKFRPPISVKFGAMCE